MEEYLFKDESIITRTKHDIIVLTTHRIRFKNGNKDVTSIMLDNVNSIQSTSYSRPLFLVLGLFCFIGSVPLLFESNQNYAYPLLLAGVVLIGVYFSSMHHIMKISSASAAITFKIKSMSDDRINDFINKLESARKDILKI